MVFLFLKLFSFYKFLKNYSISTVYLFLTIKLLFPFPKRKKETLQ
ncbi:unnamed protein product [Brugia timori]|uniref:Uncharacterized protein n=1 Tax=Brugia timori TaxID=42155 RepID=A0A0R3QBX0_9BILA|nr:unnamed protein product [Brugia timori]